MKWVSINRHALTIASWIILGAMGTAVGLYVLYDLTLEEMRPGLVEVYLGELDSWARGHGSLSHIATDVVEPCTRLVHVSAGSLERSRLLAADRRRLDSRIDACVELTVSRHVTRQLLSHEPALEKELCHNRQTDAVLRAVCERVIWPRSN